MLNVIQANFHNFGKPNLQRKTFSFTMEVPIEQMQVTVNFFGNPDIESSQWFAIAPIKEEEEICSPQPEQF